MLIAVVGGKLQGVEAVYLALKAGWETLVIDKNPEAPATGLCNRFLQFEFSFTHPIPPNCPTVDLILPAVEDIDVLTVVKIWAKTENIPLAFDLEAYRLSNSKLKSDALFRRMNLPAPLSWPNCSFPVVVKPDQASGSQGVKVYNDPKAFFFRFPTRRKPDNFVIQEYLRGPSYSIEVVGRPGKYKPLQVTDLNMDKDYDCKRVTAPTELPFDQIRRFEEIGLSIAKEIRLTGIMDVEVILNKNELKILEIDARFPSQTPMTVFWSTGINMVEMLGHLVSGEITVDSEQKNARFVIVEHIMVIGTVIEVLGEHIMAGDGPLTLQPNLFGADEAITSYAPGKNQWVATMVFSAASRDEVSAKRQNCYEQILELSNLTLKE